MKYRLLTILSLLLPLFTFAQEEVGLDQKIDQAFQPVSDFFSAIIFFTLPIGGYDVPFVLILLVASALFFTIYFGFPNIRYFGKAINTVRGKYDAVEAPGNYGVEKTEMAIDGDIPDTIFSNCLRRSRCYILDDYLWFSRYVDKICRMYLRSSV